MKRKLFFLLFCLPLFTLIAAEGTINIQGRVTENTDKGSPVAYATVALMREDSTLVAGTACREDGNFTISKIVQGDYILAISYVGYQTTNINLRNLSRSTNIGNIRLSEESVTLNTVTVTASSVINQIDRKLIFPSEREISTSANGIDLLSNMQLSGIEVNPIKNTIEGSRGGSVNLRINGAPATLKEIQAINPKYVIRIEHHDEPSLRYGGAEAVIDYIVRKKESGGSVMADARHSLDPTMGEYFASGKFNYNKSEISMSYGYGISKSKKGYQTNEENFLFEDGSTLTRYEEGLPGKYKGYRHGAKIGYSYQEPDKNLFNANFSYSDDQMPYYRGESLLYSAGNKESAINVKEYNKNSVKNPSLDLYYQHKMKNKQFIALNVVGTYFGTQSDRVYRENLAGVNLTAIDTYIDLDKYSIIGEAIYEKTFDAGRLSGGVKYNHSFIDAIYTGNTNEKIKTQQNTTYAYAEWMGKVDKFTYALGLGVTQTGVHQDETDHNEVRFTPSLLLSYDFSRAFQVRLRTETVTTEAPLSELYDVDQAIDSLFIRRGNPNLKAQMTYVNRLSVSYNKKIVRFAFNVQHRYMTDPIMRTTLREDDKFVLIMENHKRWHQVRTSATLNVKLYKDYLSWMGDFGHNWIQSTGHDFNHLMRNFYVITSLRGNYKSWNAYFQVETRRNHMTNEALYYGRNMMTGGVGYRYKSLMLRGMYSTYLGDYFNGRNNYNQYASARLRSYEPEQKNFLMVNASWNFDFGRKYRSGEKKINNADYQKGLMDTSK